MTHTTILCTGHESSYRNEYIHVMQSCEDEFLIFRIASAILEHEFLRFHPRIFPLETLLTSQTLDPRFDHHRS